MEIVPQLLAPGFLKECSQGTYVLIYSQVIVLFVPYNQAGITTLGK